MNRFAQIDAAAADLAGRLFGGWRRWAWWRANSNAGAATCDVEAIEQTASGCHPHLEGGATAFSVPMGGVAAPIVVIAVPRRLQRFWEEDLTGEPHPLLIALRQAIRKAVEQRHRVHLLDVVLVPRAAIPREIRGASLREFCRQRFLNKSLPRLDASLRR